MQADPVTPNAFGESPNGLGKLRVFVDLGRQSFSGALQAQSTGVKFLGGSPSDNAITDKNELELNLSWSSSVFGKSSKVQPRCYQLLMIIKA